MPTKTELIDALAARAGVSKKDAGAVLNAFIDEVTDQLKKGDKVQLTGFGTFEAKTRNAREGRNPRTGEKMQIESKKVPTFSAGKGLKDAVGGE
jgi:DNA-binding protein HU-beta